MELLETASQPSDDEDRVNILVQSEGDCELIKKLLRASADVFRDSGECLADEWSITLFRMAKFFLLLPITGH